MSAYDGYMKLNDVELPIRTDKGILAGRRNNRYFVWRNTRYYLSEFVTVDSRPGSCWVYPDYISAVEAAREINPIYIEMIGGYAVNIYREGSRYYV